MKLEIPERQYGAYIFDCDGTLVDSMPLHHVAWSHALAKNGASFEFNWELFMSRAGMGLEPTVLALNEQFDHRLDPHKVVQDQRARYTELMPKLRAVTQVVEFARANRGKHPLCVASGGEREVVLQSLEIIGTGDWFEAVVCHEDVARGKPHPDMFLRCAELVGVSPSDCLVFEDGASGLLAAQAAGMDCVYVPLNEQPRLPD